MQQLELSESDRRSVAALGVGDGMEEGPTLPRSAGSHAVARAVHVIEDSGTTVMDPVVEVAGEPFIAADPRGVGVPLAEEPTHDGDTARMRVGAPIGPALPFVPVGVADEPSYQGDTDRVRDGQPIAPALPFSRPGEGSAVDAPAPGSAGAAAEPGRDMPHELPADAPEAYTVELRRRPAAVPALPFSGGDRTPVAAPAAAAGPPPSSRWASTGELDASELPSAQLAEIAASTRHPAPRAPRPRALRVGLVLLALALVVGALLALGAMLRW